MALVIGPRPELLDDPRRLRRRRVDEAVAERLRARRLLGGVAHAPLAVILEAGDRRLLGLGELLAVTAARAHRDHVQVDAHAVVRVLHAERGGDRRTPVAALRAEAVVAECGHQLGPGVGDALDAPPGAPRLVAEPVAGHRRADDVERIGRIAAVLGGITQRHRSRRGTRPPSPASRASAPAAGHPGSATGRAAPGCRARRAPRPRA